MLGAKVSKTNGSLNFIKRYDIVISTLNEAIAKCQRPGYKGVVSPQWTLMRKPTEEKVYRS